MFRVSLTSNQYTHTYEQHGLWLSQGYDSSVKGDVAYFFLRIMSGTDDVTLWKEKKKSHVSREALRLGKKKKKNQQIFFF